MTNNLIFFRKIKKLITKKINMASDVLEEVIKIFIKNKIVTTGKIYFLFEIFNKNIKATNKGNILVKKLPRTNSSPKKLLTLPVWEIGKLKIFFLKINWIKESRNIAIKSMIKEVKKYLINLGFLSIQCQMTKGKKPNLK